MACQARAHWNCRVLRHQLSGPHPNLVGVADDEAIQLVEGDDSMPLLAALAEADALIAVGGQAARQSRHEEHGFGFGRRPQQLRTRGQWFGEQLRQHF